MHVSRESRRLELSRMQDAHASQATMRQDPETRTSVQNSAVTRMHSEPSTVSPPDFSGDSLAKYSLRSSEPKSVVAPASAGSNPAVVDTSASNREEKRPQVSPPTAEGNAVEVKKNTRKEQAREAMPPPAGRQVAKQPPESKSSTTDLVAVSEALTDISSDEEAPQAAPTTVTDTPREVVLERAKRMLEVDAGKSSAALPPKPPVRKSMNPSATSAQSKMEFEPPAAPTAAEAEEPDQVLTENLSGLEVAAVLKSVCQYLEDRDEPLAVKKAYAAADKRSAAAVAKVGNRLALIVRRLSGGATDIDSIISGSGVGIEELALIVLRVAVEQGATLLPE
jgi:hypothetical protein